MSYFFLSPNQTERSPYYFPNILLMQPKLEIFLMFRISLTLNQSILSFQHVKILMDNLLQDLNPQAKKGQFRI